MPVFKCVTMDFKRNLVGKLSNTRSGIWHTRVHVSVCLHFRFPAIFSSVSVSDQFDNVGLVGKVILPVLPEENDLDQAGTRRKRRPAQPVACTEVLCLRAAFSDAIVTCLLLFSQCVLSCVTSVENSCHDRSTPAS